MKQKQTLVITVSVVVIIVLLFGSKMFYVMKPGERAVIFHQISGLLDRDDIVGTGLKVIPPRNKLYKYDVKEQKSEETMDVLDKGGLSINVDVTIIFNPFYDKIGDLHENIGINFDVSLYVNLFLNSKVNL